MKWILIASAVGGAVLAALGPLTPIWAWWLSLGILAVAVAWSSYSSYRPSYEYLRDRPVDRGRWSRAFSAEHMPLVLDVLGDIRDSLALRKDDVDRLRPTDRLFDIYRAANPSQWQPDALEFETLWRDLLDRFHVPESELQTLTGWTVGQVIEACIAHRADAG